MNGASCIRRVASIVESTAASASVAVVVSAMTGITDQLLRLAAAAEARNRQSVAETLNDLRFKHFDALSGLVHSSQIRTLVARELSQVIAACDDVCERVMAAGELSPAQRDFIAGAGERLSAPLLAGTLADRGIPAESIAATELIVTDANYGAAEPSMAETSVRCHARLLPLMADGVIPVITGFIGAAPDGTPTTLGRNGSDYSATIIAAGIEAEEVVIWTDVDGFMTADPNVVLGAKLLPELSYADATELALFGAKVLHPKTLRAVSAAKLTLWIRKTFAPEALGTKITPEPPETNDGVKALASTREVALITMHGVAECEGRDILNRATAALACLGAPLASGWVSRGEIGLVVHASHIHKTVQSLTSHFGAELADGTLRVTEDDRDVALVTAVGSRLDMAVIRARAALRGAGVGVVLEPSLESSSRFSVLVSAEDANRSVVAMHRALVAGAIDSARCSENAAGIRCARVEA